MDKVITQLTEQIRHACSRRTALRVRGHGSKDFYGYAAQAEPLELSAYRGIISYEPSELVVAVRAGTPLVELEAALAERGQCLPFEPPHFGRTGGTCAGMVAAGLSGPARASAGGVRDFVLGVQLLNGRAERLNFGGQVIKNVAGYDVSRLLVGSLGCLGVLSEISLKVMPTPAAEATLVFHLDQAHALAQLQRWAAQPLPLNASCWLRDTHTAGAPERLFVRLRGAAAAVAAAVSKMTRESPGERIDNAQASADWAACRDLRLPFFTPPMPCAQPALALWRLSLPPSAPVLALPWAQLIEWHGGQRWLWAPLAARAQLRLAVKPVGGYCSLFFAPADASADAIDRFEPLEPALEVIHRRLKAEFDPLGIFNPGRMYPWL